MTGLKIEDHTRRARDLLALALSWHMHVPYYAARAEVEAVMPGPWWFKTADQLLSDALDKGHGVFVNDRDFPENPTDPSKG